MAEAGSKLRCPACGAAMNHHADKLVQTAEPATRAPAEAVLEIHTCAKCGKVEARQPA
jgi:ribosomal protein S27AE